MDSDSDYILIAIFAVLLTGVLIWRLLSGIVEHFIEPVYMAVMHKPLYVHFYPSRRELSYKQLVLLSQNSFYNRLSLKRKEFFEHRVATFLERYNFHGNEGLEVNDEMRIAVASTYVMLTFGLRHYMVDTFQDILLYPDIYQSTTTGEWHKGEFNPRFKIVVFSWSHFKAGMEHNDNVNLGIHEFAHVLHFSSSKRHNNTAANFAGRFERMLREINHPPNREMLERSGYFRDYAYTNQYEFLAVVLEHFFETPDDLKRDFPALYLHLSRMLNVSF